MDKHILFILDYFRPHKWGSETVFMNIITRLLRDGYKITVLTSKYDKDLKKLEKEFSDEIFNQWKYLCIYRSWNTRLWFVLSSLWKWIKILSKDKSIDIIHTSTYWWAISSSILSVLFWKKVILTVHEIFGKLWYVYKWHFIWFFYLCFERLIFLLRYSEYHCVSRYTMNSLRVVYGIPDHKLKTIYNGVDTDFWDPKLVGEKEIKLWKKWMQREDKFVLLYFWHSGKSKGIDYLIQAIPKLLTQYKDIVIVFNLIHALRDDKIKKLIMLQEEKAKELAITRWIWNIGKLQIMTGLPLKELRTLVASVDVVVAPSLSEWFGSVHTEAVAMWKPLITTNIWPLPEVLWGEVFFIDPQSSKEIIRAISHFREKWFSKLPNKYFSREKTVIELKKLYEENIKEKK